MGAVGARKRFADRLGALFDAAGAPTIKSIVRRANARGVPGSTPVTVQRVSDWRRGNRVPATWESVLPVVAVLIGDAKARELPEDFDGGLLELQRWRVAWQQARNDQGDLALRVREPGHPPYRGLSPYRAADADLFFGRESVREAVLDAIAALEEDDYAPRLVLLVGVSGAGKSSLLAAGLQARPEGHAPVLFTPGPHPAAALRAALSGLSGASADAEVLLLIDQAEELFTLCGNDFERREFVDELMRLTDASATRRVTAVMALRSDFFNDIIQFPALAQAMHESSVIVGAMSEAELREAITGPAVACGLKVEPALVDVILSDLDAATSEDGKAALLPLLSHVLEATWAGRGGRTLTLDAYRAAGGMAGSVARAAERMWSELAPEEQRTARSVLLALTIIGPRSVSRNRLSRKVLVTESEDPAATEAVIGRLVDARLAIVHDDEIELLHDAVPRVWPRMAEWVAEEKEFAPARHRIEEDARVWYAQGRPDAQLYGSKRLEQAHLALEGGGTVNRVAQDFIARSRRRRHETVRRRRMVRAGAVLLVVGALVAAVLAGAQRRALVREQSDARIAALVAESRRAVDFDPAESTRMALAAYRLRPDDAEARARLLATQSTSIINASSERHAGRVNAIAYQPGARLIASAGDDTRIRLWATDGGRRPIAQGIELPGHSRAAAAVAFAPAGGVLASGGYDGTMRLWDVRDPKKARALGVLDLGSPVLALVFTADGRSVVASDEKGGLSFVDVTDPSVPRLRKTIAAHDGSILALALSTDGRLLVSGGDDRTIRLWEITDPADPVPLGAPLATPNSGVRALAVDPDGLLAAGLEDGSVRLWSLADRNAPREFGIPQTLHDGPVDALVFGPGQLSSGGSDGAVVLWQLTPTGFQPVGHPVRGNRGPISALGLTADNNLISAGGDGRIRVWSLPPADIPVLTDSPFTSFDMDATGAHLVTGGDDGQFQLWSVDHEDRVSFAGAARAEVGRFHGVWVSLRPDGKAVVASDSGGGGFQLWDVADPARPTALGSVQPLRTRYFTDAVFGPDGRFLVTGDDDTSLRVWDVSDPARPIPLGTAQADTTRSFRSLAISPDGQLAATGSGDAVIYLWDIGDRRHPVLRARLTGHEGPVATLVFAKDGRHLFSGGDDESIRSWDISDPASPREAGRTPAHTAPVAGLSLDNTGKRLVSSGTDQTVRLWDIADPSEIRPLGSSLSAEFGWRWFVGFDRKHDNRVFGIGDSVSELWRTDPAEVAANLCALGVGDIGDDGGQSERLDGITLCPGNS
ncbi:WD40 repeat domain-containing protein [Nocardia sp. CDC160]|uniref:WD40 repeat domain-containing protein n=1 Tax=Nocardia sp. CDC160 TaxID=3112166 RepID=UPI002DB5814F|nr:WD40 repeat domain-containing protein [Nocardia sp. CDC160]MEC3915683.1 WD40 repeat domain-containing protein [Nocardia sp. CDC160]